MKKKSRELLDLVGHLVFLFILLVTLASCGSTAPGAPQMSRKVKYWNGAPEKNGICRLSSKELAEIINQEKGVNLSEQEVRKYHQGLQSGIQCIDASDPEFMKYGCFTADDVGVIYELIEKLYSSCKQWR